MSNLSDFIGGGGSVVTKTYDSRSDLRTIDGPVELLCVVESLGVFAFESGSTQIDDDETCFATTSGRWLLYSAAWDLVSEYIATESSDINDVILVGTVFNSIGGLSANNTVVITASVLGASIGDTVSVAPPVGFDGRVILTARVSQQNTVTIIFANSGAQSLNIATGFYNILVTKGSF